MRISHGQLEDARRDPAAWLRSRAASTGFSGQSKLQNLGWALRVYHRESLESALLYLERRFEARHYRRLDAYIGYLLGYDQQFKLKPACQVVFGDRVALPLGNDVELRGEIGRLDVEAVAGYSVWLFTEEFPQNWTRQLRMPLLQMHYASKMGAPSDEVSVGFYSYSQARYLSTSYSASRIARAVSEARRLSSRIGGPSAVFE